uniref:Gypsy retrotransposon integrase-like protein 1 n=1 Tax=Cyprinus carpio carpio TaxID=630221 RepID=A0A9J8C3J9_CYPCA
MPSAEPPSPPRACQAGCILHQRVPAGAPEAEVKVDGRRFRALLDSGSAVTLIQSRLCAPRSGRKNFLPITCVHGDTRQVPAREMVISSPQGTWPVEVGLVKDLPVAVLLGRDWPGFEKLLSAATQPASPKGNRRRPRRPPGPRRRPALLASDSGREGEAPSQSTNLFYDVYQQATGGGSFAKEQREDDRLKHCWSQVRVVDGEDVLPRPHPLPHFVVENGLLYCVAQRRGEEKRLLVVPRAKTETILELAHSHPMAGHLAAANTAQRIRDRFHWPGLDAEVKATSPRTPPPSPLIPLPIIEVPFERIGMDIVGPLPKSARGHEHILVIVDYATRYPEAVPLRKATAKSIAQELFLLASRVGLPSEILTDQGTPFMSRLMADRCKFTLVTDPTVDGPRQGHQRQGDSLVPSAPGLPLRSPPSSWGRQRERRWPLPDLDSLCRSVRGHSPPSPNFTPTFYMSSQDQNDAWGGDVTSTPRGISVALETKAKHLHVLITG